MSENGTSPSRGQLRWFAVVTVPIGCGVAAAMAWHYADQRGIAWGLLLAGAILAAVGLARPAAIRPLYTVCTVATYPIGWTITHLLMAVAYYLVVTPVGLGLRLFGHSAIRRQVDRSADTYWVKRPSADDLEQYFRQF